MRTVSGEQLVGTREGTIKVRTVKRVTSKNRFDMALLDSIRGSPWDLIGSQVPELSAERQLCPIPIDSVPRIDIAVDENASVRDLQIFKKDLNKYGFTEGCLGCEASRSNAIQRPHNSTCRERMRKALLADSDTKERVHAAQTILKRTRDQQGDEDMRADADVERERERVMLRHSCRNLIPRQLILVTGIRLQRLTAMGQCPLLRPIAGFSK